MNHYVYKIYNPDTGEFYIGSRSYRGDPEEDEYMGSPITWKPNFKELEKVVLLKGFSSREATVAAESALIKDNYDNALCRNNHIPHPTDYNVGVCRPKWVKGSISDTMTGRKRSEEFSKKISKANSCRCRHIPTGKVFDSGKKAAEWAGLKYGTFKARIAKNRDCNEFEWIDEPKQQGGGGGANRKKGTVPGNATLTPQQAFNLRRLLDFTDLPPTKISDRTGIPHHVIKDMKYRDAYSTIIEGYKDQL